MRSASALCYMKARRTELREIEDLHAKTQIDAVDRKSVLTYHNGAPTLRQW